MTIYTDSQMLSYSYFSALKNGKNLNGNDNFTLSEIK